MLAWNFCAIIGSMVIIISLFRVMSKFRSSTWSYTQSLKGFPITATHTLMIHCFGVFGRSGSSGRYRPIFGFGEINWKIFFSDRFSYYGTCRFFTSSLCTYDFLLPMMSFKK